MFRLRCATARQVSACRAEAFGVGGLDASHSFFPMPLAPRALAILHEWVKSESLRKHCYAVADSMKHFAQLRGQDVDLWEAVGLLHDMDYERHPNLERSATEGHPFTGVAWLRDNGSSEEIGQAIWSQPDYSAFSAEGRSEKTLRAVD